MVDDCMTSLAFVDWGDFVEVQNCFFFCFCNLFEPMGFTFYKLKRFMHSSLYSLVLHFFVPK